MLATSSPAPSTNDQKQAGPGVYVLTVFRGHAVLRTRYAGKVPALEDLPARLWRGVGQRRGVLAPHNTSTQQQTQHSPSGCPIHAHLFLRKVSVEFKGHPHNHVDPILLRGFQKQLVLHVRNNMDYCITNGDVQNCVDIQNPFLSCLYICMVH